MSINLRPDEQDIAQIMIDEQRQNGKKEIIYPNRILHVYKVRFGSHEQGAKVWINLDLSTGDVADCWVTNKDNEPYEMEKLDLRMG